MGQLGYNNKAIFLFHQPVSLQGKVEYKQKLVYIQGLVKKYSVGDMSLLPKRLKSWWKKYSRQAINHALSH